MLIGNGSRLNSNPMRLMGGAQYLNDLIQPGRVVVGALDNQSASFGSLAASPVGYYPPYSWLMPKKKGALSSHNFTYVTLGASGSGAKGLGTTASGTITITFNGTVTKLVNVIGSILFSIEATNSSVRVGTPGSGTITIDFSGTVTKLVNVIGSILFSIEATNSAVRVGTPGSGTITITCDGIPAGFGIIDGTSGFDVAAVGALSSMLGAAGASTITITSNGISYAIGRIAGESGIEVSADGDVTAMLGAPGSATVTISAESDIKGIGHLVGESDIEMAAEFFSYALGWMSGSTAEVSTELTPEAIAVAVMNSTVEGTLTLERAIRAAAAVLLGKSSGGGTATVTFRDVNDVKDRIVATVDAGGNRTDVVLDLT